MSEQAGLSRRDFEAQLIAKAWRDQAFAQELRENPKGAIERELTSLQPGAKLPANLEVTVVEETPTSLYLVVPPKPQASEATGELSDEDLDQAAGGGSAAQWGGDCLW